MLANWQNEARGAAAAAVFCSGSAAVGGGSVGGPEAEARGVGVKFRTRPTFTMPYAMPAHARACVC